MKYQYDFNCLSDRVRADMNHDELVNLIKMRESETTERKLHFRDDAIVAAGAFANKHGGVIHCWRVQRG
jgi:hypothetical protein